MQSAQPKRRVLRSSGKLESRVETTRANSQPSSKNKKETFNQMHNKKKKKRCYEEDRGRRQVNHYASTLKSVVKERHKRASFCDKNNGIKIEDS